MDLGRARAHIAVTRRRELELLDVISEVDWQGFWYPQLWQAWADGLRITKGEAKRLVRQMELVCPKVGVSGEPIEAKLPAVREAMADGDAGAEHLNQIAKGIEQIPVESREQAELG